jgi:hypothetical protein
MFLWGDNHLYFWMQFSRTSGKVGKCDFFAHPNTDAKATGQFNDCITRVGYATVYPGQTKEEVFDQYKREVFEDAESHGWNNNKLISISRRDYQVTLKKQLREMADLEEQYLQPAYVGERMIKK